MSGPGRRILPQHAATNLSDRFRPVALQKSVRPMKKLLFVLISLLPAPFLAAADASAAAPQFTNEGELLRPENYREWIFLSAGLGMTYGNPRPDAAQRFDNVFVTPEAYKAFVQTGRWPDKTMFVLEVRSSTSKGSINKGGHYQEGVVALEAHVKDEARFPNKWGFFDLGTSARSARQLPATSSCQACHEKNGAVDETFVQFYPTLIEIAKARGTFKAEREN